MPKKVIVFSFAVVFLASFLSAIKQNSNILGQKLNFLFPSPTPSIFTIKGMGVIGDSMSDEYQADDQRGYEYRPTSLNWVEQLVKSRKINFGLWSNWGDARRTGFEYNWSRTGATTTAVLLNGQHTGLAQQISKGDVNVAIVFIGENDFFPFSDTYNAIYSGLLSAEELETTITKPIDNIKTIIKTLKNAGDAKLIMVTIPDPNMGASVRLIHQDKNGRDRVSAAISRVNQQISAFAKKQGLIVVDVNRFYQEVSDNAPLGNIRINDEYISLYLPGDEPHHAVLSDAVHPGTVMNGLFANYLIKQMNNKLNSGIKPLSGQEILRNAGM